MMRRPLLWTTAAAVLGAVAAGAPTVAGAQEAGGIWEVTVEVPATTDGVASTKAFEVAGDARYRGIFGSLAEADSVTVTVTPVGLPEGCGTGSTVTGDVVEGRYGVPVTVACNGPHRIETVAHDAPFTSSPQVQEIGVAAKPAAPTIVSTAEAPGGGLTVTWAPSSDPDSAGWSVQASATTVSAGVGATGVELPPAARGSSIGVRALRWGAGGPGTTALESDPTWTMYAGEGGRQDGGSTTEPPRPLPPTPPPGSNQNVVPPGRSGTTPTPTTGRLPTTTAGATSTLPEGYSEELPFGTPDEAFVPGEGTPRPGSTGEQRTAASTAPSAGLVRTTEKGSPGLVGPFALGLLMITVAVHIVWYLRRSKTTGGAGPVTPA